MEGRRSIALAAGVACTAMCLYIWRGRTKANDIGSQTRDAKQEVQSKVEQLRFLSPAQVRSVKEVRIMKESNELVKSNFNLTNVFFMSISKN